MLMPLVTSASHSLRFLFSDIMERKGSLHAWSNKYKGMAEIISSQSLQVAHWPTNGWISIKSTPNLLGIVQIGLDPSLDPGPRAFFVVVAFWPGQEWHQTCETNIQQIYSIFALNLTWNESQIWHFLWPDNNFRLDWGQCRMVAWCCPGAQLLTSVNEPGDICDDHWPLAR